MNLIIPNASWNEWSVSHLNNWVYRFVGINVEVIAVGTVEVGVLDEAMDLVSLGGEKLNKIWVILSGDAVDQYLYGGAIDGRIIAMASAVGRRLLSMLIFAGIIYRWRSFHSRFRDGGERVNQWNMKKDEDGAYMV